MSRVPPAPRQALNYGDFRGGAQLRAAIARMLEDTFMHGASVSPEDLVVLAGAGAVVDQLFFCIASAGDAVLIPAPYYPGTAAAAERLRYGADGLREP